MKLEKGLPNQKRKVNTTLASFQRCNSHIDLIAFVYEFITEGKELTISKKQFEKKTYKTIESIKTQLGKEKYIEVLLFIKKIKKKYVTDLRKTEISEKETLVFITSTGEITISYDFNCMLLLKELQCFYVPNCYLQKFINKKGE